MNGTEAETMSYLDETRLQLIYRILGAKLSASRIAVQYLSKERHYDDSEDRLYMREAHFIMAVGTGEGKTMSELAKELDVTHGAVSQTASRLEKKGYLLRRRDEGDRRQIVAVLTEKGRDFYAQHLEYDSEEFASLDERFFSRFSEEELRMILEYEQFSSVIFDK